MGLRENFRAGLARQLGHPSGLRGRVVGAMLNRRNRDPVTAAVAALGLEGGETALDIGFGGGLGLALLLRKTGTVHGAEVSTTMLERARRTFRRGDPEIMSRAPLFTEHGFRIRPPATLEAALAGAGLEVRRRERLGSGRFGFHLLVSGK